MQEVDVILVIKKRYIQDKQESMLSKIREAEEEIKKIGIKIGA
jgi:hypothetical protein